MKTKNIIIALAALLLSVAAGAQTLRGSYFFETSAQRNKMNPAFAARSNYFGIPVLTSTGVSVTSNMGLSDFVYPIDGKLYPYLNQNVSAEQFLNNIPKNPYLGMDFDASILTVGFYTSPKSFWTVDMGLNVGLEANIPKGLFEFSKLGMPGGQTTQYNLGRFGVYETVSLTASVGYSRDMSDLVEGLRLGAKARFILPMSYVSMKMDNATLTLSEDIWSVSTDAQVDVAGDYIIVSDSDDELVQFDPSKIGPAGFGMSFDLGAEYVLNFGNILDGLTVSASVTDLGFIGYGAKEFQSYSSTGTADFEGFQGITIGESMDMDAQFDDIADEFLSLVDLEGDTNAHRTRRTRASLYIGAEMPFLNNLMSAGLLYSAKFGYAKAVNELTLAYNLTPAKWFNFGLNYSFIKNARSFGWVMEFNTFKGVNFFMGMDTFSLRFSPQMVPVDKFVMDFRFGLTFSLGSKHMSK